MKKILLSTVLFLSIATPVMAQDSVIALPNGQTALNISATERVEVDQDTLVASLRIEVEDLQASKVQNDINIAMEKAVALVKKYPSLKVETGQYYVYPDYRTVKNNGTGEDKQEISKWRGAQTLVIKSKVAVDVLDVTGKIQDMGFVMNGLNYELSMDKYEDARDSLMEKTVVALQNRAQRVAKALGKTSVDIVEINVDAQPLMPQPVYARAQMMEMSSMSDAKMAAPQAQAGADNVSMTINARAILK